LNSDDIRRLLFQQRKLFGTEKDLAAALGMSRQALNAFVNRKRCSHHECPSKIYEALGLKRETKTVTVTVLRPKEEL
jgi:hypothetical protein